MFCRDARAAAPMVGTILLIGIAVVFASAMFFWVMSFKYERVLSPATELFVMRTENATHIKFCVVINAIKPLLAPEKLKWWLCSASYSVNGEFTFTAESNTSSIVGTVEGWACWEDVDNDSYYSPYDIIRIEFPTEYRHSAKILRLQYTPEKAIIDEVYLE